MSISKEAFIVSIYKKALKEAFIVSISKDAFIVFIYSFCVDKGVPSCRLA